MGMNCGSGYELSGVRRPGMKYPAIKCPYSDHNNYIGNIIEKAKIFAINKKNCRII